MTYSHSESVGWGKVISYSPGGKQEKGTKITINVSTGTAGKLVTASEYNNRYSNANRFSSDKRYRYATRQKETGWFGANPGSGWTSTGESRNLGSTYGSWTYTKPAIGDYTYEDYIEKRSLETQTVYVAASKSGNPVIYSSKRASSSLPYDSSRKAYAYGKNKIQTGQDSKLGEIYKIVSGGYSTAIFVSGNGPIYLVDKGTQSRYRVISTKYSYEYWRWGAWSGWGDWTTKQSADGVSVKEDSTVMYYVVGKTPQ